ncbi:filamentous haemagglutinin family outer membrane protein [Chlorobaculum parvum NCIB 8327]|uniref:Filamentous haemagglutinin family outer membrane protein n=1 Tax=Chlorobaculum parvum (strain DSM 263 / NCIMB 8327) TaxID=517417 RepID=B3QPC7_CHLP8|nr:filamentous hemagglutinin N-terminal domain-containing protein [Chlorobaculum parvum]ACF11780.1 filamentous haemagglutinin family outer membrane protein [Chlorobaculum parvum NCIB 8327]
MNKIFRIVWSAVKDKWIVVSEKSSAKGAYMFTVGAIMSLAAFMAMASPAMALDPGALPTGGQVAAGSASITTSGTQMTVDQATQQLIANWSTFNIGEDASVNFVQPNSTSVALNRISDQNPSEILGTLSANGNLMLVNRAGVMFGKTATVNVGGLVASSLDISDSDFLTGNYQFTNAGSAGSVVNEGAITANGGVVAMIAPKVTNNGTISAPSGSVAMMAGDQVTVQFLGDGMISYTVDKGTIDALVENNSLIQAGDGYVVMTAKAADALTKSVVNQTGIVQATGIKADGGRIILDADGGQVNLSGTLDVSSAAGNGGSVVVTGDEVNVQSGALIAADATDNGDGGTVVLSSDEATTFAGTISAEGGPNGGNGGFAEVSSLGSLDITGHASLLAPAGTVGTLLLDPHSIAIIDGANDGVAPSGEYSKITNGWLAYQLNLSTVDLVATNDINFLADLTYSGSASTLTLNAPTIVLTGDGTSFSINASTADLNLNFGTATDQNTLLLADATITTLGDVTFNGNVGGDHDLTITAAQVTFNNGATGGFSGSYWDGTIGSSPNDYYFTYSGASLNNTVFTLDFTTATVTSDKNGGTNVPITGEFLPGNATFRVGDNIHLNFNGNNARAGTEPVVVYGADGLPIDSSYYEIMGTGQGYLVFNSEVEVSRITFTEGNASGAEISGTWIGPSYNVVDVLSAPVLTNLDITGPTYITGNITTTEDQTYVGNVALNSNSVLTARDVAMSSLVNLGSYDLTVNNTGTASYIAGTISGTGSLTKDGTGTLVLIGNNTYSGTTTISDGTLRVGSGMTSGTLGTGNVLDNSHLVFNRSDTSSYAGVISGTGDVTKDGAGTLILTGDNTYSGTTTINAGTLQVGNNGTTGTLGTGQVTDDANLLFYRSNSYDLDEVAAGGIVGDGNVTLASTGGDVSITNATIAMSSGSTITVFSGTPDTANLFAQMSGPDKSALKYKAYGVEYGDVSIPTNGTYNFFYRTEPTLTVTLTDSKTYDGTNTANNPQLVSVVSSVDDGDSFDSLDYSDLVTSDVTFDGVNAGSHNLNFDVIDNEVTPIVVDNWSISGYDVQGAGTGTITQAPLTITGGTTSHQYDGTQYTNTYSVTSGTLYGSDAVTGVTTLGTGTNAGTYNDNLTSATGSGLSNYDIDFVNGSLTITQAPLTITGGTTSHQYDGTQYTNTYSVTSGTLYGSDAVTGVTTLGTGTNAGTYNDNLTSATGSGLSNYDIDFVNGSLTITQAPLTITGGTTSHQYDGTQYTNTYSVTSGTLYGSDAVTGVTTLGTGTNAGTYNDNLTSATGSGLSNYDIDFVNGSLTITQAPLTITGGTTSHQYDGTQYTNTYSVTSGTLYGSDAVTGVTTLGTGTNAGTYNDNLTSATGSGLSNYDIDFVNGSLTITQAPLTITGGTTSHQYDGTQYTNTYSVTSGTLYGSDAVTGVTTLGTGTNAGTYNDNLTSATGSGLSNYDIDFVNGSLTITQAPLTITGGTTSHQYDGTQYTNTYSVTSGTLYGSDAVTGVTTLGTGTNAGTYNDNLTSATGSGLSNYDIDFVNGSLTITQAPLTITANDDSKTYDAVAYTGGNGVTYFGFVNGEDISILGTLVYTGNSQGAINAGTYQIIPAIEEEEPGYYNYSITYNPGTLTIEQSLNPADVVELIPPGPVILPEDVIGGKGSNPLVNTTGMDFGSFAELTTGSAAELIADGSAEETGGGTLLEQSGVSGETRTVAMGSEGEVASSEMTSGTVEEATAQVVVKLVRNAEAGTTGLIDVLIPEAMLRSSSAITFELPKEVKGLLLKGDGNETVKLENNNPLPAWITYNRGSKSFTAINPPSNAFPMKVAITDSAMLSWVVDISIR